MRQTFTGRNGSIFYYYDEMIGEIELPVQFPTRVTIIENSELKVYLSAEDLMEFILHRLRAEGVIHFDEGETTDLIHYEGKRRKDE